MRSCEGLPQIAARTLHAGLDGAARDPEQQCGFVRGETVEDGGLHDGSQLRCEPLECEAEIAVLHADQHLLLGRVLVLVALRPQPLEQWAPGPEAVEQVADADPPQPRGDLAGAPIVVGRPPHGHEEVLHHLFDDLPVGASPRQPCDEPCLVAFVELVERAAITLRDRGQQLRIGPFVATMIHTRTTVPSKARIGSRAAADHGLLTYHSQVRLRLLGVASIIVVVAACGSDGDGTRPSISATFPPVGSVETPVEPPATDAGALPVETPAIEQPPAETEPVEPSAPAVVTDPVVTDPAAPAAEVPSDEGDGTVWWPWAVLGGLVIIGALALVARRRPSGPTWQARTTSLLDEIEQLTSHLVAVTPAGLHAVARQDATTLATMRATLRELIESAPDVNSRTVLTGLTAPLAELHGAIDAIALSAEPSPTPAGTGVSQLAAQVHTVSTSVRATLAVHRG